jgi:hypothetical protein
VTAQSPPRSVFRRAVANGNLLIAEMTAREFGRLTLTGMLDPPSRLLDSQRRRVLRSVAPRQHDSCSRPRAGGVSYWRTVLIGLAALTLLLGAAAASQAGRTPNGATTRLPTITVTIKALSPTSRLVQIANHDTVQGYLFLIRSTDSPRIVSASRPGGLASSRRAHSSSPLGTPSTAPNADRRLPQATRSTSE